VSQAVKAVETQVRSVLLRDSVDPLQDRAQVERIIHRTVQDYDLRSLREGLPQLGDPAVAARVVMASLTGLGRLQPFLDDPEIEEIWLNGCDKVFIARAGVAELTALRLEQDELRLLVERMLAPTNRHLDLSSPFVDATLPDGSRLHVAIPDVTPGPWYVNIRKFVSRTRRLADLVSGGSLSPHAANYLEAAMIAGLNILVSGPTQAGKTTLLGCLTAAIPPRERLVIAEEVRELSVPLRDVVALQCRPPNLDGAGEITLRRLVKEALRMRPDRMVIGEVREAESLDLLLALNAGLPGAATIHANSARDALTKLCALPLLAGPNISQTFVTSTVSTTVDLVVHCSRRRDGRRYVEEIAMVGPATEGGVIEMARLFFDDGTGLHRQPESDPDHAKFRRAGLDPRRLLAGAS
jgi:pilus assembly protein CpaF